MSRVFRASRSDIVRNQQTSQNITMGLDTVTSRVFGAFPAAMQASVRRGFYVAKGIRTPVIAVKEGSIRFQGVKTSNIH
jgi:hypothetical protein